MCTGISHVYRCPGCSAVVYKLKEAAQGYTCYPARQNGRRGTCRTGVDYSTYDRLAGEYCLFCEIHLGGEVEGLSAETCDEGGEPWEEDREDDVVGLDMELDEYQDCFYVEDRDGDRTERQVKIEGGKGGLRYRWSTEPDDEDGADADEEGGAKVR